MYRYKMIDNEIVCFQKYTVVDGVEKILLTMAKDGVVPDGEWINTDREIATVEGKYYFTDTAEYQAVKPVESVDENA